MECKLIMSCVQTTEDREAWLKLRNSGIGGSDIASIMGLNPWKSAYALYCEKAGLVEPEDLSDNEYVYWGNVHEPAIAKRFCELTGKKVKRWGTVAREDYPWMLADFDRLIVGEDVGLECKTASAYKKEEWEGDNLPDSYYCQIQWYMAVSGFKEWWIACLLGGNHFEYKLVPRNDIFIEDMVTQAEKFWDCVQAKVPPAVDGSESTSETLKKIYPESQEGSIALSSSEGSLIQRIDELTATENVIKQEKEECINALKLALGDNESGVFGERKVSWKTQKGRTSIDTKKLKAERPEIFQAYSKVGAPIRVFKVK